MNWSGNFREGLAREIRENKTLANNSLYSIQMVHSSAMYMYTHYDQHLNLRNSKSSKFSNDQNY